MTAFSILFHTRLFFGTVWLRVSISIKMSSITFLLQPQNGDWGKIKAELLNMALVKIMHLVQYLQR